MYVLSTNLMIPHYPRTIDQFHYCVLYLNAKKDVSLTTAIPSSCHNSNICSMVFLEQGILLLSFFRSIDDLAKGKEIHIAYLDFTEAFNIIPHCALLNKLTRFRISGQLINWFQSYLSDRYQRVQLQGTYSNWLQVLSGVAQGSKLGPLLFLVYIDAEMYPECVIAPWDALVFLLEAENIERRVQLDTEKKCLWKLQTPGKNSVTRYANLCFVKTIFIRGLPLHGPFRCKFSD